MSKKDELFVLIKSLTKSEKRYFRIQSEKAAKQPEYLRLFNAIEAQTVYDEAALKVAFKGEKFTRQLHVAKHYLRTRILKNLRSFHVQHSQDAALKDTLRNVEILFNKELYFNCETELKKAEKIAIRYELLTGYHEVLSWKRKLAQNRKTHNFKELQALSDEQQKVWASVKAINNEWQRSIAVSRSLLQNDTSVPANPHQEFTTDQLPLEGRVLKHNTEYLEALTQSNPEKGRNSLYSLLSLLEQDEQRLKEQPGWYVSTLNNLLSYLVYLRAHDEALELIQKAKSLYEQFHFKTEQKTLLKQIMRTFNIELEIYRTSTNHDINAHFLTSTVEFVKQNLGKMPKSYQISFMFQLAYVYFKKRDFSKSLHWINRGLSNRLKDERTDVQIQIRLLNLLVHFEEKNYFVLLYFVDSTRRFIKKHRALLEYEQLLLRSFVKLSKLPKYDQKSELQTLQESLFPNGSESVIPTQLLTYIDYRGWLNAHL